MKNENLQKERPGMRRFVPGLGQPLLWLLLLATPLTLRAQDRPSPNDPLPIDPNVTVGTLDNGIRYFIRTNGRPENRAELRLAVNAGSVLETDDQQGLAHLLEHMAFNGTANFEKQELVEYLESIGMNFGPDVNAYTSFDETVYMLQVPTDDPEIMTTAFQILEDWAHQVTLEGEEIDKERGVVIEEWRLGRGANARMMDQQFPILFQGSHYAKRLPIGKVEVLESFPHEAIRRFYEDWYRPDLMAVVAVGDFDAAEVESAIREHFSRVPIPENPPERVYYDVPGHAETLFAIASDAEATNSQVAVMYKQEVADRNTLGGYRQLLAERLITAMLNARIFEITQQADPPFPAGVAGKGRFVRTSEFFQLAALVPDGGVRRGMEALLLEAERVARHGFVASEMERGKANLLRGLEQAYNDRENQRSRLYAGEYVSHFLEGEPIPGIEFEYQAAQALFPTITTDEVNQIAASWLTQENRVVMVNSPEKEGLAIPTDADLAPVFTEVGATAIEPYEDTTPEEPLMDEVPAPGSVVEESTIPELNITEWTLSNDIRVVMKPTDFKEDEVLLRSYSPGGYSLSAVEEHMSASNADQVVAMGGVGAFSMVDLQRKLAGKAVRVSPSIGELTEGLSGSASPDDLETLFQLIHLYFADPRKDETAFQAFRSQMEAFLANRSNSPMAAFQDTILVTMGQGHPRAKPLSMESFQEIDLDEAFAFYQDRFADASDFTFVFVGAFEPQEIRPLMETYLGSLPDLNREESWVDMDMDPPTGVIEKEVVKGVEPQSQTQIIFTGPFEYTYENRLGIRVLTSVLDTRLREVVREELSGTYGVGVGRTYEPAPEPNYSIRISFGSDPERVEELVEAIFAEIRSIRDNGPRPEDVDAALEQERRAKETNVQENGWWATQLRFAYEHGTDPHLLVDDSRMARVTPETVQRDARLWLNLENYVKVSLFPEGGGQK
jgi:zinc protease